VWFGCDGGRGFFGFGGWVEVGGQNIFVFF